MPTAMQTRSVVVPSADATPIFVRVHRPVQGPAERTLLIVHGMGQHGARYRPLAERAVRRGWRVVAGDLRGHGRSGGVPTHLDRFDQYLADLDAVVSAVGIEPERTAIFAHSMGGLAAARYLQTRETGIRGVVLSSPLLALKVRVPQVKRAVGRLCTLMAPRMRFRTRICESQITSNPQALELRRNDPLGRQSVTAGWNFQVLDAVCEMWAQADRLTLPLLLLQGGGDCLVDPEATYRWLPRVASCDKTLMILPDRLHELLNEPGWEDTVDEVLTWLDRRLPGREMIRRSSSQPPPQSRCSA